LFRGYPPVAASPDDTAGSASGRTVIWNPPVSFDTNLIPPMGASDSRSPSKAPYDTSKSTTVSWVDPSARDTQPSTVLPSRITVLQVLSTEPYRAHILISDCRDEPIRTLDQEFGYQGEFENRQSPAPKGLLSYLVWDMKDAAGRDAPDGVYLWKMRFTYGSGAVKDTTQLIGVLGPACDAEVAP
jgi:hypothetical protein